MYNLSDVNHVFDESSFKSYDNQAKQWITVENNHQEYFKDVSCFGFALWGSLGMKCRGIKHQGGGGT